MSRKHGQFPAFLGIGAARSGTTWLSDNLVVHPDIWIPRIKELHYFTRSAKYDGPSQLLDANPLRRLLSPAKPYRKYRQVLARAIGSNIIRPSWSKLRWDANYLLRAPSDEWYASLFSQGRGRVTGEITPRYSMLDSTDIRKLKAMIPDLKLIFIMREPVERTWSLIKYHEQRSGKPLTDLPARALRQRAFADVILRQSDYESILARWRAVFPPEQLLEIYLDEVRESPHALLREVFAFLGLRREAPADRLTKRESNGSFSKPMPHWLRAELVDYYRPMVERLSNAEGGYFTRWLESYPGPADGEERRCSRAGGLPVMPVVVRAGSAPGRRMADRV